MDNITITLIFLKKLKTWLVKAAIQSTWTNWIWCFGADLSENSIAEASKNTNTLTF
jgi:hypothetical protein